MIAIPLAPAPASAGDIRATTGALGLGSRVNGLEGGACSAGACAITGGTGARANLFHRFSSFDASGAITGVTIDSSGYRNVVLGVTSPLGSFIDRAISLSSGANLFWLSPGGLRVGAGASFANVQQLSLSTATGLRFGGERFDVFGTTAARAALLGGEPLGGRAGLVSDPAALQAMGLSTNGDLTIAGGLLTVDSGLLVDAQGGHLLLQGARIEAPGGTVDLQGADVRLERSSVDVSSLSGRGGTVTVSGEDLRIAGTRIQASGSAGGGTVLVGGGERGADPGLPNARRLDIDAASGLNADATSRGDGGRVVAYASERAAIEGELSARGGPLGGDGGFAETSGGLLQVGRAPDLSAAAGRGGRWLLDPGNVDIVCSSCPGSPSATRLDVATINTALDRGTDVRVEATAQGLQEGRIRVQAGIEKKTGTSSRLDLLADGNIDLDLATATASGPSIISSSSPAGTLEVDLWVGRADSGTPRTRWFQGDLDLGGGGLTVKATSLGNDGDLVLFGPSSTTLALRSGRLRTGALRWDTSSSSSSDATFQIGSGTPGAPAAVEVSGSYIQQPGRRLVGLGDASLTLRSSGRVQAGASLVNSGPPGRRPSLTVADGANLELTGSRVSGFDLRVLGTGRVTASGSNDLSSSTLTNAGTLTLQPAAAVTVGTFTSPAGSTVRGSGDASLRLVSSGELQGAALVGSTTGGAGSPFLAVAGGAALRLGDSRLNGFDLRIDPAGAVLASGSNDLSTSTLTNAGTLTLQPGAAVTAASLFSRAGSTIDLQGSDSTLAIGGGSFRNLGRFGGTGTLAVGAGTGVFENGDPAGGAPSSSILAPKGLLAVRAGSFRAGPGSLIEVDLSRGDQLQVFGSATLGGALRVSADRLYGPGTSFDPLLATTIGGAFAPGQVSLPPGFVDQGVVASGAAALPQAYRVAVPIPVPPPEPPAPPAPPAAPPLEVRNPDLRLPGELGYVLFPGLQISAKGQGGDLLSRGSGSGGVSGNLNESDFLLSDSGAGTAGTLALGVREVDAGTLARSLSDSDQQRSDDVRRTLGDVGAPAGSPDSLRLEELQRLLSRVAAASRSAEVGSVPAVLTLSFTENPRTAAARPGQADSFLDLTLIPREGDPIGRRVELSRETFAAQLRLLYRQLARQEPMQVDDPASPARQLHAAMIAPLASALEKLGINVLLIVPDRGLQAVPFAALHDGTAYLGERFGFSVTPSLRMTSLGPPRRLHGRTLAAGASEFEGLAPLPLVPRELAGIPEGAGVDRYLNRDFTPQVLLSQAADPRYERMHVATHAEFLPGGPAKARIQTGTGPVALQEFARLRQKRGASPLELFALSACRTALGDSDSELGFAGLALQAGARSAIGTLWYVDDVATTAYFLQLYRYLDQGLPKAEALKATRTALATGLVRLEGARVLGADGRPLLEALTPAQQRRIAGGMGHPYFWAGVELLGTPW